MEHKMILNQKIVFHEGYAYVHLREGPYLSAGRRFGWRPASPGLSLNGEILREAWRKGCKIRVFVNKKDRCFEADPGLWLMRGEKIIIKGVTLFCLPWRPAFFKTVKDFPKEILQCFKEGDVEK